ncbi:ABC transporter ATP-binding protein [Pseudooceanicola nanhaiensis]|uniref:ABC transporter ATP-binding protein n=1 Tax=Pseudooceanicola nanhaiensis TaxID=375761 RepID=UPI0035136076
MARLTLTDIRKSYGGTEVLRGIDLTVADGEFLSLVGASGCGKSTLLRIISGLESPDAGKIALDGRDVGSATPKERGVAMVFQDYALYPHMSVAQNMAMPLIMARLPMYARLPGARWLTPNHRGTRSGVAAQVERVARQLRIDHLLDRRPAQLSGGQRQRVALGRALVRDPSLFLMDEPLSNLDAKLRVEVRREIVELHRASGLTFVYVTHDQTEAMTMSDRVALLREGRLLQVAAPGTLYADPASVEVARFVGTPEISLLPAVAEPGGLRIGTVLAPCAHGLTSGRDVIVGLRPEALAPVGMPALQSPEGRGPRLRLELAVEAVEDLGAEVVIHARLRDFPDLAVRMRSQKTLERTGPVPLPDHLTAEAPLSALLMFDAEGQRLRDPAPVQMAGAQ